MKYLLKLENICKSYDSLKANYQVNLNIKHNSIHALLGENGAGKSTLINVIYGLIVKDEGDIFWQGKKIDIESPIQARKIGIGIVLQHFALFDALTVLENIALGVGYKGKPFKLKEKIITISKNYKIAVEPDDLMSNLTIGAKQRVEIIRCLLQQPKLLILDEPTSVLTPMESKNLFKTLIKLKNDGCSVLFISHKLDEVKQICDEATILRQGLLVAQSVDLKNTKITKIAKMMVGSEIGSYAKRSENIATKTILKVSNYTIEGYGKYPVLINNLKLKSGKILGIAGISGNGQNVLMSFLAGEILSKKETIKYHNKYIGDWSVSKRNQAGILFVPTERLGRSAVTQMNLLENSLLSISNISKYIKKSLLRYSQLHIFSKKIIKEFNVKTKNNKVLASNLSGGNLQKFIVGRAILQNPQVLLIENPTWGVDINSAVFIRNSIMSLRDKGVAILVASEDLDELFTICDEIAVISAGKITKSHKLKDLNFEKIGVMMTK